MERKENINDRRDRAVKNSSLAFLALGLSATSQILTQIIIAYLYGASPETDAFFVAFTIPVILFWAIHNSSRMSLVPMFTEVLDKKGSEGLWRMSGKLLTVITLFLILFSITASLLSPYIIRVIAPGLDEKTSSIAGTIFRILPYSIIFAGIMAIWVSIQNIFSRFFMPALVNLFRALLVIAAALIFYETIGIYAIPVAFVAGSIVQCAVLIPGLRRDGYSYRYLFSIRNPEVKIFFSLTLLPFLSLLLRQGSTVIDRFLASFLPIGSISALTYSYTIAMGIILIVSGGLFSVSLPEFSHYALKQMVDQMKDVLRLNLKLASIICFPVTVLLIILGKQIIRILYQRGAFDSSATDLTASLLSFYSIGIFFLSIVPVMLGLFYAFKDTVTPFIHLVIVFSINILLAVALMKLMGVSGLAMALSLSGILSFVRISVIIRKKMGTIFDNSLLLFWLKTFVSSAVMGLSVWLFKGWYYAAYPDITMSRDFGMLFLSSVIALVTFGTAAYLLKLEGRDFMSRKVFGWFDSRTGAV